jgi:hypothetical protein
MELLHGKETYGIASWNEDIWNFFMEQRHGIAYGTETYEVASQKRDICNCCIGQRHMEFLHVNKIEKHRIMQVSINYRPF